MVHSEDHCLDLPQRKIGISRDVEHLLHVCGKELIHHEVPHVVEQAGHVEIADIDGSGECEPFADGLSGIAYRRRVRPKFSMVEPPPSSTLPG